MDIYCLGENEITGFSLDKPFIVFCMRGLVDSFRGGLPEDILKQQEYNWHLKENCCGVLRLIFDDINTETLQVSGQLHAQGITKNQAIHLCNFVLQYQIEFANQHIEDYAVVCQCVAGISRSAGIAAALAFVFNGCTSRFHNAETKNPNPRVLAMCLSALLGKL